MWKDMIAALFDVRFRHLGQIDGLNATTNLVPRTVGFLTEIQTGGFPNTSSKRYVLETIFRQRDATYLTSHSAVVFV
jgi:hypothetical protein